jgi:hypothetical protein
MADALLDPTRKTLGNNTAIKKPIAGSPEIGAQFVIFNLTSSTIRAEDQQ